MKTSQRVLLASAVFGAASAFPGLLNPEMVKEMNKRADPKVMRELEARVNPYIGGTAVNDPAYALQYWNQTEQYVSTTGQYAWVAPSSTDQRGPCPGLNALANHNYIPHNGVGTIQQFIDGTLAGFGMAVDLGGFLSVYAAVFDGNLVSWSIGGPTNLVPQINSLLGPARGLSGSHNNYESDVSPTRPDLYEYGNDYVARPEQFAQLYNYQSGVSDANSNYNLLILEQFRSVRWDQSVAGNPYFFNAPFSGVIVQPAAYTFIYRFMANHTQAHPEGQLTQSILKSFFSMKGPNSDGSFNYTHGYERIPDNWYRRSPSVSPYTIPYFLADLAEEAAKYPKFLSIGGNTGSNNSFVGVDVGNLTYGVYNAKNLTPGNATCLAYEFTRAEGPDILDGLYSDIGNATKLLGPALASFGAAISQPCPKLQGIDNNQFTIYPGYKKSGGV